MGTVIYYSLMKFFRFMISIAALFNTKARLWIRGRKGQWNYIAGKLAGDENVKKVWFHCASLGEFEQARPVIEAFREKYPNFKIILTFFSPSGYEVRKNYSGADYVFYLPLDTPYNARRFVKLISPDLVFFVKYDFWYFILRELNRKAIPVILFSAIFRDNQLFFKKPFRWYTKLLFFFEHIFVQDDYSAFLLRTIGYYAVTVAGDTRFDRVVKIASKASKSDKVERFRNNHFTIVAGSTWQPDEEILAQSVKSSDIKLVLAPHNVNAKNIDRIEQLFAGRVLKCSVFEEKVSEIRAEEYKVLLIDSIGRLSYLYRYADIAYIGGGFGAGIHNILEAAVYGCPVVFGPNFEKFKEARDLIKLGAAFVIESQEDFLALLKKFIRDKEYLMEVSQIAKNYVAQNTGATETILEHLHSFGL